jgi:hypothetical protein
LELLALPVDGIPRLLLDIGMLHFTFPSQLHYEATLSSLFVNVINLWLMICLPVRK